MNTWKRRWCVLKDETFLWFRSKQEALKQGWLHKKGGGSSTLSRRNWKRRWFVLRHSKLMYFENDSEEKMKGILDIHDAKYETFKTTSHTFTYLKRGFLCLSLILRVRYFSNSWSRHILSQCILKVELVTQFCVLQRDY